MENNYQRIIGFLGKDPEHGTYGDNKSFCRLSVPTSTRYKDSAGQWQNGETTWHDVVVYKPYLIDRCKDLQKGSRVIIEGMLAKKKYQNQEGQERLSVSTIASDVLHLVHMQKS